MSVINERVAVSTAWFRHVVVAGFVYAIYEHEESVHRILQSCSTKTDRMLDDGRCEFYLNVYRHYRGYGRRKSVRVELLVGYVDSHLSFRFKSFHGLWCVPSTERSSRWSKCLCSGRFTMVVERRIAIDWLWHLGTTAQFDWMYQSNRFCWRTAWHDDCLRIGSYLWRIVRWRRIRSYRYWSTSLSDRYVLQQRLVSSLIGACSFRFGTSGFCQCTQLLFSDYCQLLDDWMW
jgi:hypothetical protein